MNGLGIIEPARSFPQKSHLNQFTLIKDIQFHLIDAAGNVANNQVTKGLIYQVLLNKEGDDGMEMKKYVSKSPQVRLSDFSFESFDTDFQFTVECLVMYKPKRPNNAAEEECLVKLPPVIIPCSVEVLPLLKGFRMSNSIFPESKRPPEEEAEFTTDDVLPPLKIKLFITGEKNKKNCPWLPSLHSFHTSITFLASPSSLSLEHESDPITPGNLEPQQYFGKLLYSAEDKEEALLLPFLEHCSFSSTGKPFL